MEDNPVADTPDPPDQTLDAALLVDYLERQIAQADARIDYHAVDADGEAVDGRVADFVVLRQKNVAPVFQGVDWPPSRFLTPGAVGYLVGARPKEGAFHFSQATVIPVGGPAADTPESAGVPVEVMLAICLDRLRLAVRESHVPEYCESAIVHVRHALAALHARSRVDEVERKLKEAAAPEG